MISLCRDEMGNMMGVCSDQYCAHGFVIIPRACARG